MLLWLLRVLRNLLVLGCILGVLWGLLRLGALRNLLVLLLGEGVGLIDPHRVIAVQDTRRRVGLDVGAPVCDVTFLPEAFELFFAGRLGRRERRSYRDNEQ